jgi:hypothetical protein
MKMGIHKNTLGYTRMPIKIGIQLARLAEIHQLQDENVVLNRIVPYRIVSYRIATCISCDISSLGRACTLVSRAGEEGKFESKFE